MKIRRIEPIAVRLPLRRSMKMAGELVSAAENVLVRLETQAGVVGWGEAASAPTMTGETVQSMLTAVARLAPGLVARPLADLQDASRRMEETLAANHAAKSAIDMALHDALGKETGKPLHELLGGALRAAVPVLWTLAAGVEDADVAEASEKRRLGFRAFKIKVGVGEPEADAARTAAICRALGGVELVCADANAGWTPEQAVRYVREIEPLGLAFLEQPVAAGDFAGMARVAAASRVPIGFDEGVHSAGDIRAHHAARAISGGSLKTIKLGGLGQVLACAKLCHSLGLRVNLAGKIAESGIASAALLHLAAAVPAIDWGVSFTSQYLAEDLVASPLRVVDGRAEVPRGPGLGIEVLEDRLPSG